MSNRGWHRVARPVRTASHGVCLFLSCVALSCAALPEGAADSGRPLASPASRPAKLPVTTVPAVSPATTEAAAPDDAEHSGIDWNQVAKDLGRTGVLADGIYTVTIPRDDLDVSIEGMPVPSGAGIQSVFHFYRCSCGKAIVIGQFVLADYEANDVVDALRAGGFKVSSLGPLLLHEHPRLMAVRFQAEGKAPELAKTLRETLSWTGKERMAPDTMPADE